MEVIWGLPHLGTLTEGLRSQGAPPVLPSHAMYKMTQSCILGWRVTSVS